MTDSTDDAQDKALFKRILNQLEGIQDIDAVDVLTKVIGALIAQDADSFEMAIHRKEMTCEAIEKAIVSTWDDCHPDSLWPRS
jgi:hypothetical protein